MDTHAPSRFDRTTQDVGNIVALEHVNVRIPDQRLATIFYISGLGLTRDPFVNVGVGNMWVNVGPAQFHLPTGTPQRLRGHTGLVLPDLDALANRLAAIAEPLSGTAFRFERSDDHIDAVSPWGDLVRCHAPDARFGPLRLGMPYVALDVPRGTTPGIARFYERILGVPARAEGGVAVITTGAFQSLRFVETDAALPPFDGHHIAIYIADFSGPHAKLQARGLVTEESDPCQYRFETIIDPENGTVLHTLEHEVRSLSHPMFGRPLVNRNAAQTAGGYVRGRDSFV